MIDDGRYLIQIYDPCGGEKEGDWLLRFMKDSIPIIPFRIAGSFMLGL